MTTGTMPTKLDSPTMAKVTRDLAANRPTTGYTPEMIAYRERTAAEFEAWKAAHPGVKNPTLWIPADTEGLPNP
jgi:hypothetical protein